jgi:hypothetical protein
MFEVWKPTGAKSVTIPSVATLPAPRGRALTGTTVGAWAFRWVVLLVLVYAASAVVTVRPIVDPDIWWHLRTGEWIVENRTVPATDPFSAYGENRPWIAYSWLFALGVYGLYQLLGHVGIVAYALLGGLIVTTGIVILILRFEFRIPRAIALAALGVAAIGPVLMPRSYLFTIAFFIIEIYVLFAARETGRTSSLWILPPLFALWANLHIQFVYGLAVLSMAVSESVIARVGRGGNVLDLRHAIPIRPMIFITTACAVATLATPYGISIYRPVMEIATHKRVYTLIIELAAPTFRQPANWVFLLIGLAGVYSLGRQRRLQVLHTLLIAAGAYFSFATGRDAWFLVIVSLVVIAAVWGDRSLPRPTLPWSSTIFAAGTLCAIVVGLAMWRDMSRGNLQAAVAAEYPTAAVTAIKQGRYPGPLYNTFNWGGFLIWQLPEYRVSMDGRSNVHGDERIVRSFLTSTGSTGWGTDAELRAARLVVLPADMALSELLRRTPDYDVAYEDAVSVVFTRRERHALSDDR